MPLAVLLMVSLLPISAAADILRGKSTGNGEFSLFIHDQKRFHTRQGADDGTCPGHAAASPEIKEIVDCESKQEMLHVIVQPFGGLLEAFALVSHLDGIPYYKPLP